ncbi:MAG TPA: hypothetical protein VF421_05720 [Niabella sp.]
MKLLTALCCLLLSLNSSAQPGYNRMSDYISVKNKNGRTVSNFYKDMRMQFVTTDGYSYEGPIAAIAKDSVFITFFTTTSYRTLFGNIVTDTLSSKTIPFFYKDIKMIYIVKSGGRQSILVPVGGAMALGGFSYDIVNIVNGSRDDPPVFKGKNLTRLGISTAVAIAGVFITKKSMKNARAKNHYKIVYINMQ